VPTPTRSAPPHPSLDITDRASLKDEADTTSHAASGALFDCRSRRSIGLRASRAQDDSPDHHPAPKCRTVALEARRLAGKRLGGEHAQGAERPLLLSVIQNLDMARFCAAIRSPIAFRRRVGLLTIDNLKAPPETVGIEFEGRLFVWHAFEPRKDPVTGRMKEDGPSVSVVVKDKDDEREAADSLQRFLSALAYYYDQPAEAVSYGGDGETDPYHPATLRAPRTHAGWMMTEPYEAMALRPEPLLRLAVAYYREGLSAGSPFYRFLAFWNCLDAVLEVEHDASARDTFLDETAPRFKAQWDERYPFPKNPAKAFKDDSRHAIAHVLRRKGRRRIDPDLADDRVRLDREANLLRWLVREAIEQKYPHPVSAADSHRGSTC
jgi:hypothetical protein